MRIPGPESVRLGRGISLNIGLTQKHDSGLNSKSQQDSEDHLIIIIASSFEQILAKSVESQNANMITWKRSEGA